MTNVLPKTSECKGDNRLGIVFSNSLSVAIHMPTAQLAAKILVNRNQLTSLLIADNTSVNKNTATEAAALQI